MKNFNMKIDSNDDLRYALQTNLPTLFNSEQITHIVAEVCGENDEYAWWWILKMKNGLFFLLSGECDYSGWDCQSGISEIGYFNSPLEAAMAAPDVEEYSTRKIKKNLIAQVKGEQPLFTYIE